ncbi:MAG: FAD-binding oxidoreductase, partial [Gammaproteobacteria bacterium]|nr:FAD-binding oxidoreductase [Gammaproteobacteria bacterium]
QEFGGSVSAEHGIGLMKKGQLHFSRSEEEIASLRLIKTIFDPDGIMNPGKLL